jgi:hypothetical protein
MLVIQRTPIPSLHIMIISTEAIMPGKPPDQLRDSARWAEYCERSQLPLEGSETIWQSHEAAMFTVPSLF